MKLLLFWFCVAALLQLSLAGPVPQDESDYGDAVDPTGTLDQEDKDPIGDAVGDIVEGIFGLVDQSLGLFGDIISNQDVSGAVNSAIEIGTNATQEAAKIGAGLISAAPKIIEEKAVFAQGLSKTVEETSGFVKQGVSELQMQAKLVGAFTKAYGSVTLEGLLKFMDTFGKRLKCNTTCSKLVVGSEDRKECEDEFCIEVKVPEEEDDDDYDYSYGVGEEKDEDNEVPIEPRAAS